MSSIASVLVLSLGLLCCSVGAHGILLVWTSGLLSLGCLVSVGFLWYMGNLGHGLVEVTSEWMGARSAGFHGLIVLRVLLQGGHLFLACVLSCVFL